MADIVKKPVEITDSDCNPYDNRADAADRR